MVFEENDNTEQVELLVAMVMEMWACLVKYASKQCIILVDWMMEAIATVSLHCPEGLSVCLFVDWSCHVFSQSG